MTNKIKFALMSGALVFGAMLASCSSEGPVSPADSFQGNILVKSPDMIAYSSDYTHGKYGTPSREDEAEYVSMKDVEINLSLNGENENEGLDFIASHLSIHLRAAQDVKVTLPVALTYCCEADDMEIVKKHEDGNFLYGDEKHELSMEIAGETVTLTVKYNDDNIEITTEGMNEAVLKALAAEFKDGLTFEVWNYYNLAPGEGQTLPENKQATTRAALKPMLEQATVEFIGATADLENVHYYVNAFNEINKQFDKAGEYVSGEVNPLDCTVTLIGDAAAAFEEDTAEEKDFQGYNGSLFNKIYKNKNIFIEDDDAKDGNGGGNDAATVPEA